MRLMKISRSGGGLGSARLCDGVGLGDDPCATVADTMQPAHVPLWPCAGEAGG